MRDHSHHIELSRDDAVAQMLEALGKDWGWSAAKAAELAKAQAQSNAAGADSAEPATQNSAHHAREVARKLTETVPVAQAAGRVLAADVISRIDAPNALTCCMDSIAVHWDDFEKAAAEGRPGGIPDTSAWQRGEQWQFANTGIAMPEGFDTAIVIEHVAVSPDEQHVEIAAAPSKRYAGTRPVGSNLQAGDMLGRAGQTVTPDIAARIASGNHASVRVVRKPRVAFIPTGNELAAVGSAFVERGKNLETNSFVVRAKVEAWGGVFVPFDIVPDKPELITAAVASACEMADIVVLNAGSSKGSDDWSVEQLEGMGHVICHQTNHGPGHHSSYALVDGTPIVGISGPSGGASFTLNFYLLPVMRRFLGLDPTPRRLPARLAEPFPPSKFGQPVDAKKLPGESRPPEANKPGDVFYGIRFLTVALSDDGVLEAFPIAGHPGSPATQHANAYCMLPSGVGIEPPEVGSIIQVELR